MRSKNLIWTTSYSPRLDYILLERLDYILLERLDYILREGGGFDRGFDRLGSTEGSTDWVRQIGFDRALSNPRAWTEVRQRVGQFV